MQTRSRAMVSPLSPALQHPQFNGFQPAITSPRTPRSRAPPTSFYSPKSNRKSSDSWNSSIHDDDMECEWRIEETLLLQRTLDALPAHILTPFNGSVPPSNLLDKIARGVASAKGPADWPHSMRATRSKIVELARARAKDHLQGNILEEEGEEQRDILRPTARTNRKKPMYRQSSMDFMHDVELSIKDSIQENQTIDILSRRLQHTERVLSENPYSTYSRPASPVLIRASRPQYSPVLPKTPSSTTLKSTSSAEKLLPALRHSFSSLSGSSDAAYTSYPDNPRVQRMKRAETSLLPSKSLKRAPSFRSDTSRTVSLDEDLPSMKGASPLDEEAKRQPRKAKKARRNSPPVSPSPLPKPRVPATPDNSNTRRSRQKKLTTPSTIGPSPQKVKRRANLERNPSILGGELPNPQKTPISPIQRMSIDEQGSPPVTPPSTQMSVRRIKAAALSIRPVGRRIAFNQEENLEPQGAGLGLGSAFQLR